MPQCLTFDCQERLPGLGNCKLRARVDELQAVILALVRDAMPCNWNDTEHEAEHVAAWREAILAIGGNPEDFRDG